MEPWIIITLIAVVIQNGRAILQKNLIGRLSVSGATYARFLYGLPLVWLMVGSVQAYTGWALPAVDGRFLIFAAVGGITQFLGNALFVHLIRASNFTVITTYIKTETVIGALLSFLILDDVLSVTGLTGVLITLAGIMVLAAAKNAITARSLAFSLIQRDALYGVAVGALYAVASTSYRGATLHLESDHLAFAAIYTLGWVTLIQTITVGTWLLWRSPAVLRETIRAWRAAAWVGVTGCGASAAWYAAFAMQVTAYVLAVGQVELVLAYLTSHFLFKERTKRGEVVGILVTMAGILVVVAAQ